MSGPDTGNSSGPTGYYIETHAFKKRDNKLLISAENVSLWVQKVLRL